MKKEKINTLIIPLQSRHADYLRDESRFTGKGESISFPESEAQIQTIVKILSKQSIPITVQGSRTGITGGCVPVQGHIMNLSRMTRITGLERDREGEFSIRVQPGITLDELNHQLYSKRFESESWDQDAIRALDGFEKAGSFFWPPDPSETSASVGGIAAGNSRGICALHYGDARDHIKGIRVVDVNGRVYPIPRGKYFLSNGTCSLPDGSTLELNPLLFDQRIQTDLLDVFIGSQGMLGVITELTLSLKPLPSELWGIVFFFEALSRAAAFVQSVTQKHLEKQRQIQKQNNVPESVTKIVALELMDHITLELIRELKQENTRLGKLPDWEKCVTSAVYVEIHGHNPDEIDVLSEWLLEKAEKFGSDPDTTWASCGKAEVEQFRLFRHAAPEAVNQFIDKARLKDLRINKLGTDMGFKKGDIFELLDMYCQDLKASGLKAAIFGHAAEGHLHVNILPRDYRQFEKGKALIENWAAKISDKGGQVVIEHGVGKIKQNLFRSVPLPLHLKLLYRIKKQLDPKRLWNPGNMVDSQ